jgi:hypothetical protein
MTTITINVSGLQLHALEQHAARQNAQHPDEPPITAAEYLQARVADTLLDYCRVDCRISGAAAIMRLTDTEIPRIRAAIAVSPEVRAAAEPLLQGQRVELAGPLWQNGIALLAAAGLLDTPTADRVAALLAPPEPHEAA